MRKKIVLCIFLVTVIIIHSYSRYVNASEETGGRMLKEMYYEQLRSVSQDNEVNNKNEERTLETYKANQKIMREKFKTNVDTSYYGGSFIDENKLIVMTNNKQKIQKERISADVYSDCKYSYEELENTYDELNNMADKFSRVNKKDKKNNILNNVCEFGISIQENRVIIGLKDINDTNTIDKIKKCVSKCDTLKFIESTKVSENSTSLRLGRKIFVYHNNGKGSYLSIGIKAYYINSKGKKVHGFITAGHGTEKTGENVYISNDVSKAAIGKVVKRKYSGKVDAAFVKLTNSDYNISRTVYYSNAKGNTSGGVTISKNIYTVLGEGAIGSTVYKAGYRTYLTKGKLLSDRATCIVDGVTMKDLYKSSYKSGHGDSGGVVYYHDSDGNQYLGVHEASSRHSDGSMDTYAVKWENIDDAWNIYFE